jgi:hypothetical protein
MPPRTRNTAVKKTDAISVVDQIADDADAVAQPTEYPDGAPALKPMLAIRPFSRRAEFKRRYAEVAEQKSELDRLQVEAAKHKQGSEEHYAAQLRMWAAMDDIFEKVNNALRMAAVDVEAYDRWSDNLTDDNDLMTTFNVYQQRTQPGEA